MLHLLCDYLLVTLACLGQSLLSKLLEQEDRVLARRLPSLRVQCAEYGPDARLPGPEEVVSEIVEFF